MRTRVLVAVLAVSGTASAEPRLDWSAFFGVDDLGAKIGLGGADMSTPEQRPQTAPMLGGRIGYTALRTPGDVHGELGVEGTLALTPSWTGYGFDGPRPSYFAPVFGMRGSVIARLAGLRISPHVVGGAGGALVVSSSPYIANQAEAVFFWGPGVSMPVGPRWRLRADAIQTFLPALGGGRTATYELQVGFGAVFGGGARAVPAHVEHVEVVQQEPAKPPVDDWDSDYDGVPDRLDKCPHEMGDESNHGCPEEDPDHDHVVGAADKCPTQPEDVDGFQDDDGCPDPDNDGDGIPDAQDKCPNQPETKNGYQDADGCPDKLPPEVGKALAAAASVKFEPGRARLAPAGKDALDKIAVAGRMLAGAQLVVVGHPEAAGGEELAKKRADVAKWYLVDQGMPQDQLSVVVGAVAPKGPAIEITLGGP